MTEPHSDIHSINHLKRGNLTGLDALIQNYQLQAIRTAYLIVQERQLAEDIVQEAFVKLVDRIHRFDESRPFAPWFFRCVINDALKALKKQKRWHAPEEVESAQISLNIIKELTDPQTDPESQVINQEKVEAIWDALKALPADQRAVIVHKYYLGFSEAEMSARLERPAGTIKWLLHTARKQLRSSLVQFRKKE